MLLPYFAVSSATSLTGLGLSIMLFMLILPVYFVFSPLVIDTKHVIVWIFPIFNAILFLWSVRLTFNNSADDYLIVYIPLAYLALLIKFIYKRFRKKT